MAKHQGPKISIITACYNSEKTIEQTIQSVIGQTYQNIEYIIVDGASTDGTMDIIKKYEKDIDIVISEPDRGVYDAFNKGIKISSGDYVYFLNSDDYLSSNYVIEQAIHKISDRWEKVDVFYGQVICTNRDQTIKYEVGSEINGIDIKEGTMIPHQAFFSKRKLYDEYGLFNTEYKIAADYDFLVRIIMDSKINLKYLPIKFAVYCNDGISSNYYQLLLEYQKIIKKHYNYDILHSKYNKKHNYNFFKRMCQLLLDDSFLKDKLKNIKIYQKQQLYIFGSMELAQMLDNLFTKYGISCNGFLDNNPARQNNILNNKLISSPEEKLKQNESDTIIIIATEGFHEEIIKEQLLNLGIHYKNIYSWRELLY